MTKHHEEMIEKLEATIKEAQFQIEELKKPKSNYPLVSDFYIVQEHGTPFYHNTGTTSGSCARLHASGNHFSTRAKLERSNLYKILNSEYDYWFPGFSEKPDFEPNGVEAWEYRDGWRTFKKQVPVKDWEFNIYRWKRSEN